MKSIFCSLFFILFTFSSTAQKGEYLVSTIADSLKENANAVVRFDQTDITITSQRSMNIKTQRVVTILNEKGSNAINAVEGYSKNSSVKSIEAIVYDAFGKEIKKIKRKDFKDQSAVDGGILISDNRYLYLEYTPISYPYTIIYNSEIETSTTAFIPSWMPLSGYHTSVEKIILNVKCPANLGFRKKELQFSNFNIKKGIDSDTELTYVASNILAQKREDYSPPFNDLYPKVMMGLEFFNLEGIDGNAKTWKEFGKWWDDKILVGTDEITDETKVKMRTLVGNEQDPIKKAKLIYKFLQQKARYVAIAEGIGGWKPMLASDVDRVGYGDCKALTNYTKALLKSVGVESYYTKLYGGSNKKDIRSDFVSQQGNHIILAIPTGDKYIWLECTSQDDPFGYQGTFTDDRDVLIIKPEGGVIARTTIYDDKNNTQISKGNYALSDEGNLSGAIAIVSGGSQYSKKMGVEKMPPTDKEAHYKNYWDNINNLKINKTVFLNDKENVKFTEEVQINASNYGVISGSKMMFVVDAFNQYTESIKRIRNRKSPLEIQRGYFDTDEIEINLPASFTIEFLPASFELKGKFGEYKTEIIKKENNKLLYKRSMLLNKGKYSSKEYDEYRLFMEQINKNDNAKIILTKN
ncbi:DUF3857 domain-containing protein [Flavobacterium sp. PS2]|uniref:DUF3857 domain-containing protein n=1 Tax=Flavobacterium sp. PS2 TaxID=3384157 RepID=UPI00390C6BB1